MADLSVTHSFSDGDIVDATKFNTNYSDIVTYVNNRNAGSSTWDVFKVTRSGGVPLVVNNSSGTQSIVQIKDNGSTVFEVHDGGVVSASSQSFGRARRTSSQGTTTTGSDVLVLFPTNTSTQSEFDSNGKFTATLPGKYYVGVHLNINQSAVPGDDVFELKLFKNGSVIASSKCYLEGSINFTITQAFLIQDIISLASNDYLEVYINISSLGSGGLSALPIITGSFFEVMKLS